MITQHQARLLQLFQDAPAETCKDYLRKEIQTTDPPEESSIGGPVTIRSEGNESILNSRPPTPRQQYFNRLSDFPIVSWQNSSSINIAHADTEYCSTTDLSFETSKMAHLSASTSSWGAWGQSGGRPEFDSSKYGRPRNVKPSQSKATATHQNHTPAVNESALRPLSDQKSTTGLGDGLVKPNSGSAEVTNGISKTNPSDTMLTKVTENTTHPPKPSDNMTSKIAVSSDRQPQIAPAAKTNGSSTALLQPPTTSRPTQWGQAASEPAKAVSAASEAPSITQSEIHAAPRAVRPSIDYYQQRSRETRKNRETGAKSATPEAQLALEEQFERARLETFEGVDRRLNKRREKKNATANLAMLNKLRQPMSADKEKVARTQVEKYQKLGESPLNWPSRANDNDPGSVSKLFARSRKELRDQRPRAGDHVKTGDQSNEAKAYESKNDANCANQVQASKSKPKRNLKWVTPEEVKPEAHEVDSNAWGSANPDDATISGDSLRAVNQGAIGRRVVEGPDPGLVGWDGKLMEAPADWEGRPRSHPQKYYPGYGGFAQFLDDCFHQQYPEDTFVPIPLEAVMDLNLHADGIGMVPRTHTMTLGCPTSYFGYSHAVISEVSHFAQNAPGSRSQFLEGTTDRDFDDECPASEYVPIEIGYIETSEIYSQRLMALKGVHTVKSADQPSAPLAEAAAPVDENTPKTPAISIYLRPAAISDLPQLTKLYNWHIAKGPRPTEMSVISEVDMRDRFDDAVSHKLPLIVAIEKVKVKNRGRNPSYQPIVQEEKVVGWSSAADWSASDYVERISAEIEIYVHPEYRLKGVGRCLLDKMLQICDRGYISKGGYDFHCLPEMTYMYGGGGARDLHKIWFILRTWSKPVKTPEDQKLLKASDREDEVDIWLKAWLESMDFEQEGHLKQVGAKDGRFIDQLQFGRFTMWLPRDGEVPDPLPGTT